jgi:hypothetical protein
LKKVATSETLQDSKYFGTPGVKHFDVANITSTGERQVRKPPFAKRLGSKQRKALLTLLARIIQQTTSLNNQTLHPSHKTNRNRLVNLS